MADQKQFAMGALVKGHKLDLIEFQPPALAANEVFVELSHCGTFFCSALCFLAPLKHSVTGGGLLMRWMLWRCWAELTPQ